MKEPEQIKCRFCNGAGYYTTTRANRYGNERCSTCNGTGKVLAPAEQKEPEPDQGDEILCEALSNKRLCKVLLSDKNYLIITETEPYFKDAYDMMKKTEQANGTWTEEDQQFYDRLFPAPRLKVGDIAIIKTKEGKIYHDTICLVSDKSIITSDGDSFDAESMLDDSASDGSTNGSEILYIVGVKNEQHN